MGARRQAATAVGVPGSANASIWIVEPDSSQPFRKLIELSGEVRPRGITWTREGSSLIFGRREALSDFVLFERLENRFRADDKAAATGSPVFRSEVQAVLCRSPQLIYSLKPADQWVPTGENLGHQPSLRFGRRLSAVACCEEGRDGGPAPFGLRLASHYFIRTLRRPPVIEQWCRHGGSIEGAPGTFT